MSQYVSKEVINALNNLKIVVPAQPHGIVPRITKDIPRISKPQNDFKLVQLESPYRGTNYEHTEFNKKYAEACVRECLLRGESAMASHLLFTGATDDTIPEERAMGIEAGLKFLEVANYSVVYIDLGISYGMRQGIKRARLLGKEILYRKLNCFDEFLEENRSLLNGFSHIVGKEKEYTLKDELINDLLLGKIEYLFIDEFGVNLFGMLGDNLDLIYPIDMKEVKYMNNGVIGGISIGRINTPSQHEEKYKELLNFCEKWKLNRKLKEQLQEKTKTKKSKI